MQAQANGVLLKIDHLTGGYDPRINILHDVSVDIQAGEIFAVIGPNGAGKSTFFRMVYGFLRPRSGEILLNGEPIGKLSPIKRLARGMSYVPQGRSNFALMSVRENLEMGAFTRRDANIERDIQALMERFPVLNKKQDMLAGNLSGGEQQMLEMAMALLLKPRVLMLDEPSLGLAPLVLKMIFEQVKEIKSQGITVMLVEQNAKQALEIADHAMVLVLGKKRFEGTGREILASDEVKRLYLGG